MVVRAPAVNEGLKRLGATAATAGRLPARGRHPVVEQLADGPDMVGDPRRHRRGLPTTVNLGKTVMGRTNIVDRAHQIHPACDGREVPGRATGAAAQHRQSLAERAVQTLDGGRVEHLTARRAPQQGQKQAGAPVHQAMYRARHRTPGILLDHLGDGQLRPRHQPRAASRSRLARPKDLANRIKVGHQSVTHEQQRSPCGARRHDGDQSGDEVTVTPRADGPAQPQPGAHHHGHRHPPDTGLGLDVDLIGLHLDKLTLLHDGGVMDGFCMRSAGLDPFPNGLGLEAIGDLNRGNGTAMAHQGDDPGDCFLIGPPPIEGRPSPRAEGLLADLAPVTLALLAMDADVAFSHLPSCRAVHVRAACCLRIDGTPPFGPKHRKCAPIRSNFQVLAATTV